LDNEKTILFLDVDGVLNCQTTTERSPSGMIGIEDVQLNFLKELVDETNSLIVLSSTWRLEFDENFNPKTDDAKYLIEKLNEKNLKIYDMLRKEMNQYVFVLNEQGERITSFVDNMISKDELLDHAKKEWPDAADYIYSADGDSMLDEFMKGKFYVNGEFVVPQPKEPTKAEQIAEIKNYYDKRFDALDKAVLRRRLANADISDLQAQYKTLQAEMVAKIKAVK